MVSLEKLSPRLEGREEDIQFLKDMLQTEEFHSIMRVYIKIAWQYMIILYWIAPSSLIPTLPLFK